MSTVDHIPAALETPMGNPGWTARCRPAAAHLCDIQDVESSEWDSLSRQAIENNVFLSPHYYVPLVTHARKARQCRLLMVRDQQGALTGLAPLVRAWDAFRLPVPALVVSQPYLPLGTPLLAGADPIFAAGGMIDAARRAGAAMIVFHAMHLGGPVADAFREALAAQGLQPIVRNEHQRAALDGSADGDTYLRASLGAKKLKELRRQRNRLADLGAVEWRVASRPEDIEPALERFLMLEASGWKGRRGTALGQIPGDAAFIRAAAAGAGPNDAFEVCELLLGGKPVASGLVFKAGGTAFFLKTSYDEAHTRLSPGVLLTLELTRHLTRDPTVSLADSVAASDHPMIDHIWRERLRVGDFFVPTGHGGRQQFCLAAFDAREKLRQAAKTGRNQITAILARRKGTAS